MNNKSQNKGDSKETMDRTPQVGALLRASRLRVGEDLREVAEVLCIRFLYLEAIEECRYADLPGDTYAVGFIRSYAEHLGLDGEEVVRRYRTEQTGMGNSSELLFPTPVQDSGVPKGAIVFVGFLIALVVYGGWYVSTTDESILSDLISPVPGHLKHLVTGDDATDAQAPADQNATASSTSPSEVVEAPSGNTTDTTTVDSENNPQTSAAAVEQIAAAAGEVASRTAEAAREAAETAAEAVTTANSTTNETQPVAEKPVQEVQPEIAPSAETTTPNSEPVQSDNSVTTTATPSEVAETSAQPEAETTAVTEAQSASEPEKPSTDAAVQSNADISQASSENVPATNAETNNTPETTDAAAPVTALEDTSPAPKTNEVTAEDLNTLVLRQATAEDNQVASSPSNASDGSSSASSSISPSGISILATSKSWVEVRNPADGRVLFTGVMGDGSTFDVPDISGLLLDTGNAGALDITVNGESVPKIGGTGDVRKGVALNAERLKAGTATTR